MSVTMVTRAVWRRFAPAYVGEAARHVRAGGYGAVVQGDPARGGRVDLFFGLDAKGRLPELALWALLAIGQRRWRRVTSGAAGGLATARVSRDYVWAVLDWCDRDAVHPGPTRTLRIDCLACAACCHESRVLLGEVDLERWRDAGRSDLAGRAYVRRERDGALVLRPHSSKRCQHLRRDNKCRIYALRPDNCSAFLAGSEACLSAREDTRGWRDG